MPRRYRQKSNACAKVSPEDLPVSSVHGCLCVGHLHVNYRKECIWCRKLGLYNQGRALKYRCNQSRHPYQYVIDSIKQKMSLQI